MNTAEAVLYHKRLRKFYVIKAHTIRICEKRFNLLTPKPSDANILNYDLENLKKQLILSF